MKEQLLSMKDVGKRLDRSYATVRGWKMQGKLPEPDMVVGVTPLWWPATIDAWWAQRSPEPAPETSPDWWKL